MNENDITVSDVIVALRYCTSDDGTFCDMCRYNVFGSTCSKRLLKDASDQLKYFHNLHKDGHE